MRSPAVTYLTPLVKSVFLKYCFHYVPRILNGPSFLLEEIKCPSLTFKTTVKWTQFTNFFLYGCSSPAKLVYSVILQVCQVYSESLLTAFAYLEFSFPSPYTSILQKPVQFPHLEVPAADLRSPCCLSSEHLNCLSQYLFFF